MRILLITTIAFLLSTFIAACGLNNNVKEEIDPSNDPHRADSSVEEKSEEQPLNSTAKAATYPFTVFDLQVDYNDLENAINIEFDFDGEHVNAIYKDTTQDINLFSEGAMEELDDMFSSFQFTEETSHDEVLKSVTKAFNIPEDAKNIELEITYNVGVEKEYSK